MGVNSKKALCIALCIVFVVLILAMIAYITVAVHVYEEETEISEEYSVDDNETIKEDKIDKEGVLDDEDGQKSTSSKILKECCKYHGYNYSDLKYVGIHNMMDSEFDNYLYKDGFYLTVERDYPYSVYLADNMASEAFLIWENGEPMTSDKKDKIELAEIISGYYAYEQYLAIKLESEGMYSEYWRDLGEFQNCDEIIYLEEVYNNFYQCMHSARGDCFVYVEDFEIEEQLKSLGVTPIKGHWRWARLSQGHIYLNEYDVKDNNYTDISDLGL